MRIPRTVLALVLVLSVLVSGCTPASAAFWGGFAEGFSNSYQGGFASPSGQVVSGTISGSFDGLAYGRVYVLTNGQVWQQSEYYTWYWYASYPSVLIFRDGATYRMRVDGIDRPVAVVRLQ